MEAPRQASDRVPTADDPEVGTILLPPDVPLAEVAHWIEDGAHHFRGLELDVISMDEDEQVAVNQFVEWTEDLLEAVAELSPEEITPSEQALYNLLSQRFREAYARLEERERRRRWLEIHIGRRRRAARGNWRPSSGSRHEKSAPELKPPAR